jgi:dTDP-4-dehydrorhamnose reductase
MKVVITGANGFLGHHLTVFFVANHFTVFAFGRNDCRIPNRELFTYQSVELTDEEAVAIAIQKIQPQVIIHTAAMSKPNECEQNKKLCVANNVNTTTYLVAAANKIKAKFIFISTDFIFGEGGPHHEDDMPAPLNFYGESKLIAEKMVQANALQFAIVRPVFIYGKIWDGIRPTFLHWVQNNLRQGKPIKVVSDQQRTPTFVNDLCEGILAIITKQASGTFNMAGKDVISPYQMAITVANVLGLDASLIENVTAATFPEPVKRAKQSGLYITKAKQQLNYQPISFEEGVRLTFSV